MVRQVRIGMRVNGEPMAGLMAFTARDSGFFTCSTWQATIAMDGTDSGAGAQFWAEQPD